MGALLIVCFFYIMKQPVNGAVIRCGRASPDWFPSVTDPGPYPKGKHMYVCA